MAEDYLDMVVVADPDRVAEVADNPAEDLARVESDEDEDDYDYDDYVVAWRKSRSRKGVIVQKKKGVLSSLFYLLDQHAHQQCDQKQRQILDHGSAAVNPPQLSNQIG